MKYMFFLIFFSFAISAKCQNSLGKSDDFSRIALNTFIPENVLSDFPNVRSILKQRLDAVSSMNGMGGNEAFPRFVITGTANIVFDETIEGSPPKYVKTVEVFLSIGDGVEGVEFSSEIIEVKGVDDNEDKAFISAIKKINPRNKKLKEFISNAKEKIVEYYNSKCDFILKEAESLNSNKDYDTALSKLFEVPDVCKECFDKSMDYSKIVYKAKIENQCQEKISKASSLISQDNWVDAAGELVGITPDMNCFSEVKELQKKITDHKCSISIGKARGFWANRDSKSAAIALSEVSFDSSCYSEAKGLFKDISGAIDAQKKKEWDLAYEKYNRDQIIKEEVNELELELSRSDQNIKIQDSELNRELSRSDQQIKVEDAGVQRKIDMLSAEAKAYLTKKTADNQKLLIKTMGNTAVEVARANAKKAPPVYNYSVF